MADEAKEIQYIDWRRCFPFLEILRSFRIAIHPVKILLCFVGVAASLGVGVAIDQIPYVGRTNVRVESSPTKTHVISIPSPDSPWSLPRIETERTSFFDNVRSIAKEPLWGQWALPYVNGKTWGDFADFVMSPVTAARKSIELIIAYWREAWLFALINTILVLAIWSVIGTTVTRMAAMRVAREESEPLGRALRFSIHKWPSAVTSPLLPFGVIVLLALLVGSLAGMALNIPYAGEIVVGLLWGLVLLVGFLLAIVFIGGAFSVGLQWPALAVEGTDSFDAISRSISYISSRPWRYIFYTSFAAVYGSLTFILVKLVAFLTLYISHAAVGLFSFSWGSDASVSKLERLWATPSIVAPWPEPGVPPTLLIGSEPMATLFFQAWVWIVMGLVVAFLFSFFFTSQTVIYFLLRKVVEAKEMEEVYTEPSEEEPLPLAAKVDVVEAKPAEPAAPSEPATPANS
jgi:hypothetical protein